MKVNHLGLAVTDVPATMQMFEKYFGLERATGMPQNAKMGFLLDDNGALITIFKTEDAQYPNIFHIGFMQETTEQVHVIHAQLKADGFEVQEMREEHGRLTFYFRAPGNFMIEVDCLLPQKYPSIKNQLDDN